jgi:hypothetical protein
MVGQNRRKNARPKPSGLGLFPVLICERAVLASKVEMGASLASRPAIQGCRHDAKLGRVALAELSSKSR